MSYESQLKSNYSEIHKRLLNLSPAPKLKLVPKKKPHHLSDLSTLVFPELPQRPVTTAPLRLDLKSLLAWVAGNENRTVAEFKSEQRIWKIGRKRFIFYHLAHLLGRYSCSAIARYIHRDHSTIIHGIGRLAQLRSKDINLDNRLRDYEAMLIKSEERSQAVVVVCSNCPFK